MNILALDTSTEVLSVALSGKSGDFYTEVNAGTRHSELLLECIYGLFKTSGMQAGDLDLLACMKGPGSFTGLRIGFSAAKGICLASGIPLATAPTLDCMAYHLSVWPGLVIPAIDAKKGCFFTAIYRGENCLSGYMDSPPEQISIEIVKIQAGFDPREPIIITGPGAELLNERLGDQVKNLHIDPDSNRGRAMELIRIAKKGTINDYNELDSGPLYIRKSDAELNYKVK